MVKEHLKLWNTNKFNLIFAVVLLWFLITRLFLIDKVPGSLYWDEASIGYNAFSISRDLRDEWGKFLPLHFRAFGEFKLPVYIYTVAFFVKFLGLSEFAIRLPSVIFSLGTLIAVYFITRLLTKNNLSASLAAFYFAISPGLFIFSRTGYEATSGIFFLSLGILCFLKLKDKKFFLILSTLSYLFAIYSYNSMRIVAPLIVFTQLTFLYLNKYPKKYIFISLAIFLIGYLPVLRFLYFGGATRLEAIGEENFGNLIKNYLSHFNLNYLLLGDKIPRSTIPGFGVLFPFDLVFIPLGVFTILKSKRVDYFFILLVFFISFIPAAITKESPHALRSITVFVVLPVLFALGIKKAVYFFGNYKSIFMTIVLFSYILFFSVYFKNFLDSYNLTTSHHWQYGYKAIYENYSQYFNNYEKVIISDRYAQPYIFTLTYLKIDPMKFRSSVNYNPPDKWGFSLVQSFDKFEYKKIEAVDFQEKSVIFMTPLEYKDFKFTQNLIPKIIKFTNGETAFYVFEN